MKKKSNLIKVYIEAIVYSVLLILFISLCFIDNIYVTMLPIAFLVGAIGQIIFGKRVMTSVFSAIISIILLQMKTPALLGQNVIKTIEIFVLALIGELFGWAIKRLYRLWNKKKRVIKKVKNERIKCGMISVATLTVGVVLSSIFNGNYISYFKAKSSLKNYFSDEYNSSSRFKVISAKYTLSSTPNYTFYTQDILSSNGVGKFSVYLRDNYTVQDEYKEQVSKKIASKMTEKINNILQNDDISIFVTNDELDNLTVTFTKKVESTKKEEIEKYSREIVECLENIKDIDNFEEVYQIKIILESKENSKDNLVSYVFMSGYNEIIKNGEEGYTYIMNALNIEFFD